MKVVAVDFDETLVKVNSFRCWVRYLLIKCFIFFEIRMFAKLIFLLVFRKARFFGHLVFKESLVKLRYPERWDEEFCKSLRKHINFELVSLINLIASGGVVVVSSSAPERYLRHLKIPELSARIYIQGSGFFNGRFIDNYGEQKIYRLRDEFQNLNLDSCFTDSIEDLALICNAHKAYLVNFDEGDLEALGPNKVVCLLRF